MLARIRKAREEGDSGFTLIELLVVIIIIAMAKRRRRANAQS